VLEYKPSLPNTFVEYHNRSQLCLSDITGFAKELKVARVACQTWKFTTFTQDVRWPQ